MGSGDGGHALVSQRWHPRLTGCFTFTFEGDRATQIRHKSGLTKPLPEHVLITKRFALVDNWSDADASVQLAPVKYSCKELFEATEAPNSYLFTTTKPVLFFESARCIAAMYQREKHESKKGELQGKLSLLRECAGQKRKEHAAKARAARTVATQEKKKSRRIMLT